MLLGEDVNKNWFTLLKVICLDMPGATGGRCQQELVYIVDGDLLGYAGCLVLCLPGLDVHDGDPGLQRGLEVLREIERALLVWALCSMQQVRSVSLWVCDVLRKSTIDLHRPPSPARGCLLSCYHSFCTPFPGR